MVTVVAETGTGSATANSYITVVEGTTYHDGHLYATSWTAASAADKAIAVVMATKTLDTHMDWIGRKVGDTQALEWPRYDIVDKGGLVIVSSTIPQILKDATAEMSRWLLKSDRSAETDDRGFSQLSAGSLSLTVDSNDRINVIPREVAAMLAVFGSVIGGGQLKVKR